MDCPQNLGTKNANWEKGENMMSFTEGDVVTLSSDMRGSPM